MPTGTTTPGARESNAGDDFHVLWAARRAIQLLNPHSKLHKLFIEKVSSEDEKTGQDCFLGADVAEYYDGDSLLTASKVMVYQLKYSTRHPSKAWTASRLCDSSDRVPVIQRLCELFDGFLKDNSREEVIKKLKISLVSNQPATPELLLALSNAQNILTTSNQTIPIETVALRKLLTNDDSEIIHTLQNKSKLSSTNFTDFLRVLTFNDCDDGSRQIQRQKLINELGPLISSNPTAKLRELCELISKEAQPERSNSFGLSKQDVLAALGIYREDNIFPCPSRLQAPRHFIDTNDLEEMTKTVITAPKKRIIVHGNAGSGKTTIIQNISKKLPSGSVVIIYDCFGGGDYKTPGEQRHTQDRAFLQLTNDLAVHCGTPFLLESPRQREDLQRNFRKSIEQAVEVVKCETDALLLIIIDAADNAIIAAQEENQDCFIQVLWKIPLPDNCRLIMTCRSHRLNSLAPPADVVEYELKGFDRQSSSEHLRTLFPDSKDEDCLRFHSKTGGNPRMQHYLLEAAQRELVDSNWEQFFAQGQFSTLEEMFTDLWESSVSGSSNSNLSEQLLAELMCLTRPIPITILAEVHSISLGKATNFCRALEPGLTIEKEHITFRDEDFENFLHNKLRETDLTIAHNKIGTCFLEKAQNDEYAAKYVAEHLFQAGLDKELIKLVIDEPELSVVKDEILRLQVRYKRVSLALQSSIKINSKIDTIKLTMIAAELARSNNTVKNIVLENLNLAVLYGDAKKVVDIYLTAEPGNSYGAHLQAAAVLSRSQIYQESAKDHLKFFYARLQLKKSLPEKETAHWRLSIKDIACEAEAIFWVVGAKAAHKSLKRWQPNEAVLAASSYLAKSLATQLEAEELEKQLKELKLSTPALAIFLAGMWSEGKKPSQELIQSTANRLEKFLKSKKEIFVTGDNSRHKNDWAITFCEMLANTKASLNQINTIIEFLCPQILSSLLYDYMDLTNIDTSAIRTACLYAVLNEHPISAKDLLPKRYSEDKKNLSYEEKSNVERCESIIRGLIDTYQTRAQAISGKIIFDKLTASINTKINKYRKNATEEYSKYNQLYQLWACKTYEALLCFPDDATVLLDEIADTAESNISSGSPRLWTKLAKLALQRKIYLPTTYRLLERAAHYVMANSLPAKDRLEILLTCSSIVSPYENEIGREYYRRALIAANGIDDENLHLLSLNLYLAQQIQDCNLTKQRKLAARLIRLTEAHKGYVYDSEIPWQEAINAVTKLNPPDGLALCSRWDDENILALDEGIISVIQATSSTNFLSPLENLWVLRLAGREYDFSKIAIVLLGQLNKERRSKKPQLAQMIKIITDWVLKDLALSLKKRAATTIVNWAKENAMTQLEEIKDLQELLTFVEQKQGDRKEDESIYERKTEKSVDLEHFFNEARDGLFTNLETRLDELRENGCKSTQIQELIKILGNNVPPSKRVEFLEEIVRLAADRFYLNYFLIEFLVFFSNEWKGFNSICEKVANIIKKLLDLGLPTLTDTPSSFLAEKLELLLSLSTLTGESKSSLLIPSVSKHINYINSQSFYVIVKILLEDLPKDDCKEILEWSLLRSEKHFTQENKKIPDLLVKNLPEKPSESVAHFFWMLLGHPDKRIRWRVAHTVRGILKEPANKELMDELVKLLTSKNAGSFQSEKLDFYWMSARSWLLMLFLRLADEMPKDMQKYSQALADQALDKTFPHAQIREFARLTVLRIVKDFPNVLSQDVINKLYITNQPLTCFYPAQLYHERVRTNLNSSTPNEPRRQFSFDSMDTLPYWINPIARIFGLLSLEFTKIAEQWVTKHWYYSDSDCEKDPRRPKTDNQWQLKSNRHGSLPIIETLRRYLEYHAIFCSAGELIDNGSSIRADDDFYEDTWQDWLKRHLSASNSYWLSDICSPTPFLPECWGYFPPIDDWLKRYSEIDYDAGLGLVELNHLGEMVLAGSFSYGDDDRRGSTSIKSALVTPDKSQSLLLLLQMTEEPYRFSLNADTNINEAGFELQSCYYYKTVEKGLDEFDFFSWGSQLSPSEDFLRFFNLKSVNGGTKFLSPNGSMVATLEIWENNTKQERIVSPYSEGQRLWVKIEAILEYLRFHKKDLMVQVHITHNRDNNYRDKDYKYDHGKANMYILRQNGSLETLGTSRRIREIDSARASIRRH